MSSWKLHKRHQLGSNRAPLAMNVTDAAVVEITAPKTVRKCLNVGPGANVDLELGSEHISFESEKVDRKGNC